MSLGNEKPRRPSVGKPKNPALMETYAINRAVNTVKKVRRASAVMAGKADMARTCQYVR
jgi:hypothetical protein